MSATTTTSAAAAAADRDAQETLVTLLRRERNDAISSLAAAKAELEIAREDLDAVLRKRRNSPSPSRTASSSRVVSAGGATPQPASGGVDDAVRSLLNAARQRSSAALHSQQQYQQHDADGNASPLSSTTSSHHQFQQSLPLYPTTPGRGPRAASEERRLDSELMSHLELTNRHCAELERRIERYETDMHTAMARNEELQLRLDASLLRERALSEKVSMLDEELADTREVANERASAMEQLKVETTKLMMRLNTQLEHSAQMETKQQAMDNEHRRIADECARLRGANEALQQNASDLESENAAMKISNDRREEDLRQKIVILSRELASVREQRDQALRPYHARHAASGGPSPNGTTSSTQSLSPVGYRGSGAAPQSATTVASPYGQQHYGLKSPPPGPTLSYRGSSNSNGIITASPHHNGTDDVHELKRQVQWLLERSSK